MPQKDVISFQIEQNDLLALKAFHLQFLFFLLAKRQLHRRLLNKVFEIMLKASASRQETQDISTSFFFLSACVSETNTISHHLPMLPTRHDFLLFFLPRYVLVYTGF